jgi:hypothetical protein
VPRVNVAPVLASDHPLELALPTAVDAEEYTDSANHAWISILDLYPYFPGPGGYFGLWKKHGR